VGEAEGLFEGVGVVGSGVGITGATVGIGNGEVVGPCVGLFVGP
jgi:hypothetical protein